MQKRWLGALAASLLATQATAGEVDGDRWKLALGGYILSDFGSTMSWSSASAGVGLAVNPADALGMDFNTTVLRVDGGYRISDAHGITFSWYNINSSGQKTVNEEIPWYPDPIPANAAINSDLKYNIYKIGYLWSFYHNRKVELSVGAGLHVTSLKVTIDANLSGSPVNTENVNTTIPLPVIMMRIGYTISPKWRWSIDNQWFSLNFEDISGSYTDVTARIEYQATRHLALGFGVGSNNLLLRDKGDDYVFTYRNRISGGIVYVATTF